MKLTNTILALAITSGAVWAQQGPVTVQSAKDQATAVQQKQNANAKSTVAASSTKPVAVSVAKTPASQATKPSVQSVSVKANASQPAAKPSVVSAAKSTMSSAAAQPKGAASKPVAGKAVVVKTVAVTPVAKKVPVKEVKAKVAASKPSAPEASNVSVEKAPEPEKTDKTKTMSANGRRDPFVSPVISSSAVGSGCSAGKRCLAVEQISLKGVVRSETGMIAVVVNSVDKAYFLRENDPVFDGYVMKITGDSIVFKETVQDKLGKPFTKEVTKKITTPVV